MPQPTPEDINRFLDSPCKIWDDGSSWRDWLADVLITLFKEGEGFSGRRPNCNSDWGEILADGLSTIEPGIVLSRDEDGVPEDIDWNLAHSTFEQVCKAVFAVER